MDELKLFKEVRRFSEDNRPAIGAIVEFHPVLNLTQTMVVALNLALYRPRLNLKTGDKGLVVENGEYVTTVVFERTKETHLVSPNWLGTREISERAKKLFEKLQIMMN